jgi:hypothetical protein
MCGSYIPKSATVKAVAQKPKKVEVQKPQRVSKSQADKQGRQKWLTA